MIQIPKRSLNLPKHFDSFWAPEYQKLMIDYEASKHDWNLVLLPNEAFVIAANFHKFHLQFEPTLQHVSCSCQKFIDDELNWCQHLSVLKYAIQQNWKIFKKISHEKNRTWYIIILRIKTIFTLQKESIFLPKSY